MLIRGFHVGDLESGVTTGAEGLHICVNRKDILTVINAFKRCKNKPLKYLYTVEMDVNYIQINGDLNFYGGSDLNDFLVKVSNKDNYQIFVGMNADRDDIIIEEKSSVSINYQSVDVNRGFCSVESDLSDTTAVAENFLKTGYNSIRYKNYVEGEGTDCLVCYDPSKINIVSKEEI